MNRHVRSALLPIAFLLAATCGAAPSASDAVQVDTFVRPTLEMSRLTLRDGDGPPVRYYLSRPAKKAPLVLYIQGSGCVPPFRGLDTPHPSSGIFSWVPLASQRRHAVMAVDKPYQSDEPQQGPGGSAIGCAGRFNQHFSYNAWLDTLKRALRHALTRPEVDARRVLVIGISEGAPVAAGLARAMPEVTDVALVGANGPTQLFDFAAGIYRTNGSDEDKLRQLQEIDDSYRAISADPASTGKMVWGHTHLRWSSFFAQSTLENLMESKSRVYVVSGMQDRSVPIVSAEVLYAQLRVKGRDVTIRRLPNAGHGLVPDGQPMEQAQAEYDAIMAWFERR